MHCLIVGHVRAEVQAGSAVVARFQRLFCLSKRRIVAANEDEASGPGGSKGHSGLATDTTSLEVWSIRSFQLTTVQE